MLSPEMGGGGAMTTTVAADKKVVAFPWQTNPLYKVSEEHECLRVAVQPELSPNCHLREGGWDQH